MTKRERPILTAEQVRVLIDGTRDDPLHAFWVLACSTGMRVAEMLALTWEDVVVTAARASSAVAADRVPELQQDLARTMQEAIG